MGDGQLEDELRKSFFFGGIWHKIPGTKQPPPAIPKGAVQCGGPYWTKFDLFWFVREGWDEAAIGRLNGLSSGEQGLA